MSFEIFDQYTINTDGVFKDTDTSIVVLENPTPEQRYRLIRFYKIVKKDTRIEIVEQIKTLIPEQEETIDQFKNRLIEEILKQNEE